MKYNKRLDRLAHASKITIFFILAWAATLAAFAGIAYLVVQYLEFLATLGPYAVIGTILGTVTVIGAIVIFIQAYVDG